MGKIVASVLLLATLLACVVTQAQVPADAVWIDVRSSGEFAEGHLPQARHIPFDGIEAGVSGLDLAQDTPIYLYCGSGRRAEMARQRLQTLGYSNVTNVGGLDDALLLSSPPP